MTLPTAYKQMFSTVSEDGTLTLALHEKPMPSPEDDQVIVRIEASPINPSDHAVMFGAADMSQSASTGSGAARVLTAPILERGIGSMKARFGLDMPVGNEGAGTVVASGDGEFAQSLMGKVVAVFGGASMYAQYRCVDVSQCMPLLPDCTAKEGASSFVNPMTALSFVETMRLEGHRAIVHTAAASNLGQMLLRLCQKDDIDLVNIVRRPEQVELLQKLGAKHVLNSNSETFFDDLVGAIEQTGATIGFDATGGGPLASTILKAMAVASSKKQETYSIYGSPEHRQVYIYGGLDPSQTAFEPRAYGTAWGIGAWLLTNFLAKAGPEVSARLRKRVAEELTTTFASHYTEEISLADALDSAVVARYRGASTGEKFLICPQFEM